MASRFDPSAFIEAESRERLASVAAPASVPVSAAIAPKPAENREFGAVAGPTLATIATIAASPLSGTPWADDVARFIAGSCPPDVSAEHWDELVNEAETIERTWGDIAYGFGWNVHLLHGCPPEPLAPRFGQSGLVHAIVMLRTPVRLTEVRRDRATLQPWKGSPLSFYPVLRPGAVLLWEAYRTASGP